MASTTDELICKIARKITKMPLCTQELYKDIVEMHKICNENSDERNVEIAIQGIKLAITGSKTIHEFVEVLASQNRRIDLLKRENNWLFHNYLNL